MKYAIGPRRELGLRTIFNMLGPMTNPAGVKHQVLGVFSKALCRPLAEVLADEATPAPDAAISQHQTRAAVVDLMDFLTEREKQVLSLRYGFETGRSQSLRKASKIVGLSQEGVRRVEHRALSKLRRPAIACRVEGLLTA